MLYKLTVRSFDRVMRGVRLLQKHGIEYNILTTVNRINGDHPLEVYRFLRDEVKTTWIQFIPVIERLNEDGGTLYQDGTIVSEHSVLPEQFGNFLNTIFDEWIRNDLGKIFVQTNVFGKNLLVSANRLILRSPLIKKYQLSRVIMTLRRG